MRSIQGTVNWGIIGCGDVCEVKSGPAFNKVANSRLVAVMRRDAAKAEDYAKRHGVPKFYSDASQLINDPDVNAIYIATPPSSHEAYTHEAMKAGKPVYVEKPVTVNSDSCRKMIDLSKRFDVKCSVAHYRRGLPLFKKAKALINEGAIGNVRVIKLSTLQPEKSKLINHTADNWRVMPEFSGGGLFHDLSPHQLDIVYWIFGAPKEVVGRSLNQSRKYDAPDLTTLNAVYNSEINLNGIWAFNVAESVAQDQCEIVGDKGMLRFAFFRKSTIEMTTTSGTEIMEFEYPENIQQPMIDAVAKFFRGEGDNPCSLEDALVVMNMMDKTM